MVAAAGRGLPRESRTAAVSRRASGRPQRRSLALVALVALGTWQLERLAWKRDLIASAPGAAGGAGRIVAHHRR